MLAHLDSTDDAERESGRLEDNEELEELHDESDGAADCDEAGEARDLAQVVVSESLLGRCQFPTFRKKRNLSINLSRSKNLREKCNNVFKSEY